MFRVIVRVAVGPGGEGGGPVVYDAIRACNVYASQLRRPLLPRGGPSRLKGLLRTG
jgi:hypothetical protein